MNEVQEYILKRAMQKLANADAGYQPYIDVDNPGDYINYPGRTVRVKNAQGGYDYITNPNRVNKDGVQTLMAPRIMRTNAQGDYINADGTLNGFWNNIMKRFRDTAPEQVPQNQSASKDTPMNPEQRAKLENDLAYEQGRGAVLRTGLGVMDRVLAPYDAVNWGVNKVKGIVNSPAVQGGIQGVKDFAAAVIPKPSRAGLIGGGLMESLKYSLDTLDKVKAEQTK